MNEDITKLFTDICDIVFSLEDNSEILCVTTLNKGILAKRGWDSFNGFIDLLTEREIPPELFMQEFKVYDHGAYTLNPLDALFNCGGKISWKKLY